MLVQLINTIMHAMLVDKKVKVEKEWLRKLSPRIRRHSELCHILSDPTESEDTHITPQA